MGKKVLVIGSGGREHALCWKIAQSPLVEKVYCAPGNPGIALDAECVDIAADDIEALIAFAQKNEIALTVVGPEAPLTIGIVDSFQDAGLRAFGPSQKAAELEGSKAFSKDMMREAGVPTASYRVYEDGKKAIDDLRERKGRVAIKASGLAAGKGVILPESLEEAIEAVDRILTRREFGEAGARIVIEDFIVGEELSIIAMCDGETALMLESSQDHKAAFDGDEGPNTGGMGAYSPAPLLTPELSKQISKEVLTPTLKTMKRMGRPFKGILYAGLMITEDGPEVLEYNVRFGDPECQPLLMRMESDIVPLMEACIDGKLKGMSAEWKRESAVCVVMASGGYPGKYEKGFEITGLDDVGHESVKVFHAGTARDADGKWTNNGGRVLGVTALGRTLKDAVDRAYENVKRINWEGVHYRTDIAKKGLRRAKSD
ncbi:MAG: phosphoribosylamine--glycine ligase [Chrysiogenetes bacterium]|nr:phosphoribosylamine--glycine ligase [Chrysiogenetes bacterium]